MMGIINAMREGDEPNGVEVGFFGAIGEFIDATEPDYAFHQRERNLGDYLRSHGMRLRKTPPRSWQLREHGPGYMVTQGQRVLLGAGHHDYDATIDEVQAFANELPDLPASAVRMQDPTLRGRQICILSLATHRRCPHV